MIRHIVFFRLTGGTDEAKKKEQIDFMKKNFGSLPGVIPVIRDYHVGSNISTSPNAWDVVIDSTFDNTADLDEYRNHPFHRKAVEKAKTILHETAVVDYETP